MNRRNREEIPQDGSSSVFQVKHVLIAVGIALFVFVLIKLRRTQISQAAKPVPEQTETAAPVVIDDSHTQNFNKEAYGRELINIRKKAYATRVLGLKSLSLTKTKGMVNIPFEFVPKKVWCQGGDIETMRYATSKTSAKEILITLESLGNDKVKESLRVSVDNLIAGFNHTFRVDSDIGDRSLSLSICTDRKKTGSCKKANVMDQAALSNMLGATSKVTDKDYLFYFQHLIYSNGELQTYRSDNFTADYKKRLTAFLDKEDVNKGEMERAWKLNKTIRSNPVDIVKGKIVLSLPYTDPRCRSMN